MWTFHTGRDASDIFNNVEYTISHNTVKGVNNVYTNIHSELFIISTHVDPNIRTAETRGVIVLPTIILR